MQILSFGDLKLQELMNTKHFDSNSLAAAGLCFGELIVILDDERVLPIAIMEKMEYRDKVKFVDRAMTLLTAGQSREEIDAYLRGEGLKDWDVEKINRSIDQQQRHEYRQKIKPLMLDNTLESKLSEFEEMDDDLFNEVQRELIAEIFLESQAKVKSMIAAKQDKTAILEAAVNPFFNEADVNAVIENCRIENNSKDYQMVIGVLCLAAGIFLTAVGSDMMSSGFVVFYGLILYGGYLIMKSFFTE